MPSSSFQVVLQTQYLEWVIHTASVVEAVNMNIYTFRNRFGGKAYLHKKMDPERPHHHLPFPDMAIINYVFKKPGLHPNILHFLPFGRFCF